jgi:hypothetical protein
MKNICLLITICFIITFSSCKKSYVGDTYDFTNTLAPYVELASKGGITAAQGSVIKITVQMKTALTEDVTVNYSITGAGSAPINGTVVVLRNTVKTIAPITLPTGIVAPGSTVAAKLILTGAIKGSDVLRIGSIVPTTEVINLTITP